MTETWKDVAGYEGFYQVSNLGRVKSLPRMRTHGGILVPALDKDGYEKVQLCRPGTSRHFRVHRLVAAAFIENPHNFPVVNHKDENKRNNAQDNLEWCSVGYNTKYRGGLERRGVKRRKAVAQFALDGKLVAIHSGACEAMVAVGERSHANITSCCTGKRKTAGGFMWRYVEASLLNKWGKPKAKD